MHRLLCLGQLSLVDGSGQPVSNAAAQPRRLALLALLGRSAPRAVSRERLIGWFWPEADEERGRRSLNQALYALRTELGSEEVLLGQRDMRLNLDLVSCDVADFENAMESGRPEEAAGLYRGLFVDGFRLSSAPEFEQWVEDERRALVHRYAEGLEALAAAAEQRGEPQTAVGWWRKAASADPASARLAIRLMRALVASGDRSGASRHATIYQTILEQQLELPADPAVLAYAEELTRAAVSGQPSFVPEPLVARGESLEVGSGAGVGVAVASPTVVPASSPPALETAAPSADRRRPRWRLVAVTALPMLGAVGMAAYLGTRPGPPGGDGPPVVAVLPLQNSTGDSTYQLVGAMVTDWVTQKLAETGLVRVMDTRTLLTTQGDIRALATQTGARFLVIGKYYRLGDSLEFRTQITDAASGRILSTIDPLYAPASEPTGALTVLEERVTGALAVQVDQRLNNWTASSSHPPTWAAYSEFLLGMRDFGRNRAYDSNFAHFARAARLDTTYWQARLWAGISLANARRYPEADSVFRSVAARRGQLAPYDRAGLDYFHNGFVLGDREASYRGAKVMVELAPLAGHSNWALGNTARSTRRAREAVEAYSRIPLDYGWGAEWAVRILGESARAQHVLGEHEDELANARRMLARSPDDGWARTTEVVALAALRRYDKLARRVEAAVTLPEDSGTWSPFSPGDLLFQVAQELRSHGAPTDTVQRYAEAAVQWYAAPTSAGLADTVHLLGHARASYGLGRWEEARELYQRLMAVNPESPEFVGGVGAASARLGDTVQAESTLRRLMAMQLPYPFGRPARAAATVAAALGRRDEAVRFLGKALREGTGRYNEWHAHPDFLSLNDYPPFRALVAPRN
ncbi:MAG TPA: BTAD domain-containing putative transcriptional regulator [Gemmatimonadales bacterium]